MPAVDHRLAPNEAVVRQFVADVTAPDIQVTTRATLADKEGSNGL